MSHSSDKTLEPTSNMFDRSLFATYIILLTISLIAYIVWLKEGAFKDEMFNVVCFTVVVALYFIGFFWYAAYGDVTIPGAFVFGTFIALIGMNLYTDIVDHPKTVTPDILSLPTLPPSIEAGLLPVKPAEIDKISYSTSRTITYIFGISTIIPTLLLCWTKGDTVMTSHPSQMM